MIELIGKKLFTNITPYKRTFISIEIDNADQKTILTIPSTNTSAFFLNNNDLIYIDNIDDVEKLCYIDYDLINKKDKTFIKHYDDFHEFKKTIKNAIATVGYFSMLVERKIIFHDVIHIVCNVYNEEQDQKNKSQTTIFMESLNQKLDLLLQTHNLTTIAQDNNSEDINRYIPVALINE